MPDSTLATANRREMAIDLAHRVARHLRSPLRIDGRKSEYRPQIEREIGDQHRLAAEYQTGREQQSSRRAFVVDPVEIAELGDRLAGRIDDDDFVRLIGDDPDVVAVV